MSASAPGTHQSVSPSAEQATNGRIEYLTRRRLVLAINLDINTMGRRGVFYEIEATSGIGVKSFVRWVSAKRTMTSKPNVMEDYHPKIRSYHQMTEQGMIGNGRPSLLPQCAEVSPATDSIFPAV